MSIIENPVNWLIGVLCLLGFFLILFKILNAIDDRKVKAKEKEKKKEENTVKSEKSSDSGGEQKELFDDSDVKSDYFNYLHDRFVVSPTSEDKIKIKSISDAFLTGEECECIKHNKVHIHVTPVKKLDEENKADVKSVIEGIISENKTTKSKLLEEFDGLSREMKLLLIENIMSRK